MKIWSHRLTLPIFLVMSQADILLPTTLKQILPKKSKQAKTSVKSLNFIKMRQKFTQNLKNSVKFDKIKRLI